jgi:hypothetical protein
VQQRNRWEMWPSKLCGLVVLGLGLLTACPGFADDPFQSAPALVAPAPARPPRQSPPPPTQAVEPPYVPSERPAAIAAPLPAARVVGFSWMYAGQPEPGLRVWSNTAAGTWAERYPSGQNSIFQVRSRVAVDGCPGTIVFRDIETNFEVFIPDGGCAHMVARFRHDQGNWNLLGEMRDITYAAGR